MTRSILATLALASLPFALPAAAQDRLDVVASFSIIGDFAQQVGGGRIILTTLVGPDSDVHSYEPKPQDAAALSSAKVILANGAHFEGFLPRLVEASGNKIAITNLIDGVTLLEAGEHEHEAGHAHGGDEHDPHAFQSPANAVIYIGNIAKAFCDADAAGCAAYKANAARYIQSLHELDTAMKAEIAAVPTDRRSVITSHDAFAYFGQAYGIAFHAAEGVATHAAPSAADVAKLIDQAREDKAAAIFVENIANPKLVEQIARETGLPLGGTLYSDALTEPDGPASTYADLVRHNMGTIVKAISAQ